MVTEPTQAQLSAYVDGELDAPGRAELESHLAGCSSCQARLDGLRQTVAAIRALPMETPRRTFTVPAQRRQARSWAPLGWGIPAMAAVALTIFWASQLHFGGSPSTASNTSAGAAAQVAVAPLSQPQPGAASQDYSSAARTAKVALPGQQRTMSVPGQPGRNLTISTDAQSYAPNRALELRVSMERLSAAEALTIKIFVTGNGYSVRLAPPTSTQTYPMGFDARYAIADMHLPRAGSYEVMASVDLADRSTLVDYLPVAITP